MSATSYLLLAAQILSFGHLLLVRHVTCHEHGDVIHSQPHEALSTRSIVDPILAFYQAAAGAETQADADDHDHCLICATTHERFALLPPAGTSAAFFDLALPLASSSDAGPFLPVAVIVLSPKNSPPAA